MAAGSACGDVFTGGGGVCFPEKGRTTARLHRTIEPETVCVADEIIENAISAGTHDPRFHSVAEEELGQLLYSVDVLGKPERVASVAELDAKRYGVIVSKGWKRGLLLPNLDGVNTPEQQISIALKKAGIHPSEEYTIERFEVTRHR